jgi:hypothetical protein
MVTTGAGSETATVTVPVLVVSATLAAVTV